MHPHRSTRRTAAAAAVLLCAALAVPVCAGAAGTWGTAAGSESVASGTWLAVASPSTMTFTTDTDQISTVANTGTVALTAVSYQVTVSTPSSGSPTFQVFACAVAWSGGTCGGGTGTQVGSTFPPASTTTATSSVVPPVGGDVYLQVQPSGVASSVTVTVTPTVDSSTELRAAAVTNQ